MGSTHHHNDLQKHNDCQICTIASNTTDIDTPERVVYFTEMTLLHEATQSELQISIAHITQNSYDSRAPPLS